MAVISRTRALALIFAVALTSPLAAQRPAPPAGAAPRPGAPVGSAGEPKLVFDREVFSYPGNSRRDPFKPLVGKESLGPLFDDLKLKGIIYSPDPTKSIVLIQDGSRRLYRIKRGAVVGNSRVVEIQPLAARFAVENFGMIRYEVLQLRAGPAAAGGMVPSSQAVPAEGPMGESAAPTSASDIRARRDSMMSKARRDSAATQN